MPNVLPPTAPAPNVETFRLTARQFAAQAAYLADLPPVDAMLTRDHLLGHLIVRLHTTVYGREAGRDEVRVPADWWQAVKARWAPAWARRRWPVRERVIHFTAWHLYPMLAVAGRRPTVYLDRTETVAPRAADA